MWRGKNRKIPRSYSIQTCVHAAALRLQCGIPPSALGDEFNICLEQWILVEKIWALLGSSSPFMQVEKMMQLTNLVC